MNIPPAAQAAADRLGCRIEFVRLHWGPHRCLDYRMYESNCPLIDPERHGEALALMTSLTVPDRPTNAAVRLALAESEEEERRAS